MSADLDKTERDACQHRGHSWNDERTTATCLVCKTDITAQAREYRSASPPELSASDLAALFHRKMTLPDGTTLPAATTWWEPVGDEKP